MHSVDSISMFLSHGLTFQIARTVNKRTVRAKYFLSVSKLYRDHSLSVIVAREQETRWKRAKKYAHKRHVQSVQKYASRRHGQSAQNTRTRNMMSKVRKICEQETCLKRTKYADKKHVRSAQKKCEQRTCPKCAKYAPKERVSYLRKSHPRPQDISLYQTRLRRLSEKRAVECCSGPVSMDDN